MNGLIQWVTKLFKERVTALLLFEGDVAHIRNEDGKPVIVIIRWRNDSPPTQGASL